MSEAAELCYPESPDPNGSAKKYYKRRAYYFGRHNTPESLFLFAEWKRRLIESGQPPEVRVVRADLEHQRHLQSRIEQSRVEQSRVEIDPTPQADLKAYRWPLAVAIAVVASVLGTAQLLDYRNHTLEPSSAEVDGIALTEAEVAMVRGMRLYNSQRHLAGYEEVEGIASKHFADLLQNGTAQGPRHELNVAK